MGKLPKLKIICPDTFFVIIFGLLPAYSFTAHADRNPLRSNHTFHIQAVFEIYGSRSDVEEY